MKTLQVTPVAKARLWVNERATKGYLAEGILQDSVSPSVGWSKMLMIGVEALLPRGGRAEYGMIGFQFVPDRLNHLQCEVGFSDMSGPPWTDALAAKLDEVRLGLPKEYAPAVMEALLLTCQDRMPSGFLRVVDAAHGLVGSSPSVFGRLATAAVELALLNVAEMPDAQIVKILRGILIG